MEKPKNIKIPFLPVILIIFLLVGFIFILRNKFNSPKKSGPMIQYRISETTTLMAVTSDLKYYDFIKDENILKLALRLTKDLTSEKEDVIKIGNNTINKNSIYQISQTMSVWQIADILLNKGTPYDCKHGCPDGLFSPELLPGGDLAPTIKDKYEWVKTYEDCVKTIGRDGGQLSSEQYAQKTGIRKCVSPDAREFIQGKEGWTNSIGG